MQDAAVIGVVLFVPKSLFPFPIQHAWYLHAFAEGLRRADAEEHPRAYIVPAATAPYQNSSSKSSTTTTSSSNGIDTSMQGIEANITPLLADILESTNKKLAPFKRITGGIVSVDAIPKNPVSWFLLLLLYYRSLSPSFPLVSSVDFHLRGERALYLA